MPLWTVHAINDVRAQLAYVAKEDHEMAQHLAITIRVACSKLDQSPKIGRPGVLKDTRELVIPNTPYICVYRVVAGRVEILRILHARMMWPE